MEAPKEPKEPVLSQEPVLTLERRVGKDSVLEAFYNRYNQVDQNESEE